MNNRQRSLRILGWMALISFLAMLATVVFGHSDAFAFWADVFTTSLLGFIALAGLVLGYSKVLMGEIYARTKDNVPVAVHEAAAAAPPLPAPEAVNDSEYEEARP